jgi:transcriptional regulator with XRE-family HTH domain
MSQQSFADKMGVTPSTVSRWESGKQAPNLKTQAALRPDMVESQFRSKEEWVFRVNASSGHEMLFDSNDIILAVSDVLVRFHSMRRDQIVGSSLAQFFRVAFSPEASASYSTMRDRVRDDFFSGGLRLLAQISDVRVPSGIVRFFSDVWPVVASDGEILALVIASRHGPSPEPQLCKSYRLVRSDPIRHDGKRPTDTRVAER